MRARVTPGATGIASGTTGGRAESDVGSALRHGDAGRSENPGFSHTPRLQGSMHTEARSYTVGDFVRRVVGGLLQGKYRGKFLCSRCLITLTKDSLDKSYTLADIGLVMSDVFKAPGEITLLPASTCALCARKKPTPCLGVPLP